MMYSETILGALLLSAFVPAVMGQSPVWGQCGGTGYSGPKTCVSGSCCQFSSEFYSQCIPGTCGGGSTPTTTRVVTTARTTTGGTTQPTSPPPSTGGSAGCGKSPLTSGTRSVTVNGKRRDFMVRVPDNYSNSKQYKVIFALHALGDQISGMVKSGYYELLALDNNKANVIFVAPQGINNGWANAGGEDIAFMDAALKAVTDGLCVNPKQVFATGFSYGAGMSYSIACSRATVFRAVAVLSGMQLSGCAGGNTPIAYMGIHGNNDPTIPIALGEGLRNKFLSLNGCAAKSAPTPAKGSRTHVKTVYSCKAGLPVEWIAFDGNHVSNAADGNGQRWAPTEVSRFLNQF